LAAGVGAAEKLSGRENGNVHASTSVVLVISRRAEKISALLKGSRSVLRNGKNGLGL
jgi:hypothetical protein